MTLRSQSESRVVFRCDAQAFEQSTDESAYWLGFLLADGCVTAGRRFALSVALKASDHGHLEALRTFLRAESPIHYDAKRNSVSLIVSSERLVRSLMAKHVARGSVRNPRPDGRPTRRRAAGVTGNSSEQGLRGCTPRKSTTLEFPAAGLFHRPHFVRGVFDGDGSIYAIRRPYVQPTVSFVGNPAFLLGLQEVICSDVGLPKNKLYSAGRSVVVRSLAWTGRGNAMKMYRYLYGSGGPCLARKKARFEEFELAS